MLKSAKYIALITLLFGVSVAHAQTFTQISPLDFGRIAVISNNTQSTLTVDRFDNVSASNNIRIIIPGKAAVLLVSNAAPRTGIFFTASARTSEMSPAGSAVETFTFDSLNYDNYQVTDANGELEFKLGATIKTSGNNNLIFSEAPYSALIDVTLNY
jgi:hypothetical protein